VMLTIIAPYDNDDDDCGVGSSDFDKIFEN
jgi:hypothetical protein